MIQSLNGGDDFIGKIEIELMKPTLDYETRPSSKQPTSLWVTRGAIFCGFVLFIGGLILGNNVFYLMLQQLTGASVFGIGLINVINARRLGSPTPNRDRLENLICMGIGAVNALMLCASGGGWS